MTLVVIDAVGLTPRALKHMPRVSKLGADGFSAARGGGGGSGWVGSG